MDELPRRLRDLKKEQASASAVRQQEYEAIRASPDYRAASARVSSIIDHFIFAVRSAWLFGSRELGRIDRSIFMRSVVDVLESVVSMGLSIENAARNPARREIRYLIELAIKALFIDQTMRTASFDQRLLFFDRKVSTSSITPEVDQLELPMISNTLRLGVPKALKRSYGAACRYVHPSVLQIEERVALSKRGVSIGFDSADELFKFGAEAFEALGLVLVLIFHEIGEPATGDFFEGVVSEIPDWVFHGHRYIIAIDENFDYKVEREERLDMLKERRRALRAQDPQPG
jgi:hypothetical protein